MNYQITNGPQDGATVQQIGEVMPQTIYLQRKWRGDGYATWSTERSERFPCCYILDGSKFVYQQYK